VLGQESSTVNDLLSKEGSDVFFTGVARRDGSAALAGGDACHNAGRPPRNKGMRYPADPPTVEEIVAVMRKILTDRHGLRLRAMIVVLWRGGLRIQGALDLTESDLDARRGSILVRAGKGNKRREVGMDPWAWSDPPRAVGRVPRSVAARAVVLRDRRSDPRAAVVGDRGPR
jgi:integrase